MTDIVSFPKQTPPEFMIGPFEEYRVVLAGKLIPKLTANRDGDDMISLTLDNRLSVSVPKDRAYDIAWLVANALAIGAGYACFESDDRIRQFANNCAEIKLG